MTITELKANLCAYDPENPHNHLDDYDPEDRPSPRTPRCGCDNCHYGRDRLARLALDLSEALRNLVGDWERVIGPIPDDHEAKALNKI